MTYERLGRRNPGTLIVAAVLAALLNVPAAAQTKPGYGKVTGVVRDVAGTPQMGATVQIIPEGIATSRAKEFLTNTEGIFRSQNIAPGLYTVRVTLAGFLPTIEQHVRVTANLTTLVRIELESMFASLDRLRHQPATVSETDDWKWVLRSSAATRPVLQWQEESGPQGGSADKNGAGEARGRLELTSGARRPASVSNLSDAAGTAFAYDQSIGTMGRLLLAGQMSYERAPSGGVAGIWMPAGGIPGGPRTTVVFREAALGPESPAFRGVRIDQSGAVRLADNILVKYGAEYDRVSLGSTATSLRPRLEVDWRTSSRWRTSFIFAAQPGAPSFADDGDGTASGSLMSVLNQLDAFPALLLRGGRPVMEGGWHEEISAQRKVGTRGKIHVAAFHDDNRHVAVYGRGEAPASGEILRDFGGDGLVTDGGSFSAWGIRSAYSEKLNDALEISAIYAFGGALAGGTDVPLAPDALRDGLIARRRHSIAGNLRASVPHTGTRVSAGYKWISGTALSRLDGYGDSLFQSDPYLHLSVRHPLPRFAGGRWEALAEFQNLLAQGYVPVNRSDGRLVLVPAFRMFRGGLSVQF